jgi:ABC-type bacteriocin/lantibiotic exporter with double-glycine peptidase domain
MTQRVRARRKALRRYVDDYLLVLDARRSLPRLVAVTALMLVAGLLDLVGIGLIAPFVALVVGQDIAPLPRLMVVTARSFDLQTLGAVIVAVFLVKSVFVYHLQRHIVRFSQWHRARLMTRLLERYLARSYEAHLTAQPGERINTLFWHTSSYAGGTLGASLRLLTDVIVLALVIGVLCRISLTATALLALFLGVVATGVARWVRHGLASASLESSHAQTAALIAVENSLGAFREIRVLGTADAFRAALETASARLAGATSRQHALHYVPRLAVETALVAFLVTLSLIAIHGAGHAGALVPVLGAMGVAAIRLMPLTTSLLDGFNSLRASQVALTAVARELREEPSPSGLAAPSPAPGFERLELRGVHFRYPGAARDSLIGIDFEVRRGEVLGIAGRSGAGKSTLVDVLLGLLTPRAGEIRVDGRRVSLDASAWHLQCAYIPQEVFLITGTLYDNITFGHVAPGRDQLDRAIRQARLDEVLQALPCGLDSPVGERGVSLSGGERQRVAIARALFHDRSVLVMDEATSALDAGTEAEVIASIKALRGSRTVIVVAHRERVLEACDRVIRLEAGRVVPDAAEVIHAR